MIDEPRAQCGAVAYRRVPEVEILLVTSRDTGRWVIPKGGLMDGLTVWDAAAQEAYEEAGVVGVVAQTPLGTYDYLKFLKSGEGVPCRVTVYPMAVTQRLKNWPERDQRRSQWFRWKQAAEAVHEPDLSALIRAFGAQTERDVGA